jgi:hypothetical protein
MAFNSETQVKRGDRVVHGDKEMVEKLGRNDPCPCGSGRRFQGLLLEEQALPSRQRLPAIRACRPTGGHPPDERGIEVQILAGLPIRDRGAIGSAPAS